MEGKGILTACKLPSVSHQQPENSLFSSVCMRPAVQSLSLKGVEEEQVVFSFELGPHAPRASEGIVWSKQKSREKVLFL